MSIFRPWKNFLFIPDNQYDLYELAGDYSIRARMIVWLLLPIALFIIDSAYQLQIPIIIVSAICVLVAIINQPYPFLRSRFASTRTLLIITSIIDIAAVSLLIHFLGGVSVPVSGMLFLIIILLNGLLAGSSWAFIMAGISVIFYMGSALIEIRLFPAHSTGLDPISSGELIYFQTLIYAFFFYVAAGLVHLPSKRFRLYLEARKYAQAKIDRSELKYRQLFNESHDTIYYTDKKGKILDINRAGEKLTGYSADELIGMNIDRSLYANPRRRERWLQTMKEYGRVENFEITVRCKDGSKRFVLDSSYPVLNEVGSLVGFRGFLRDNTDIKKLEEHVIQAQKFDSLGNLAGGIAHDFNNMLTIIQGSISTIKSQMKEISTAMSKFTMTSGKYIEMGEGGLNRGMEIAQRLLKFARVEESEIKPMSIVRVIDEMVPVLINTFDKAVTIRTEINQNIPPILGDRGELYQVLLNLCLNARDAILDEGNHRQEGTITLSVDTVDKKDIQKLISDADERDYVRVSVSDTGCGIDEEVGKKLFEPFYTTKPVGKGTGLGLSVVYGIVKNHRGFIDYVSERGRGTTFNVYIPVIENQLDTESFDDVPEELPLQIGGSRSVLIAEDEKSLRDLLTKEFQRNGYTVLYARDGKEAVDIYGEHRDTINGVILDGSLPKLPGREVFKQIRHINPAAKIMIVSGFLKGDQRAEFIEMGATAILKKPYKIEEVIREARKHFENS